MATKVPQTPARGKVRRTLNLENGIPNESKQTAAGIIDPLRSSPQEMEVPDRSCLTHSGSGARESVGRYVTAWRVEHLIAYARTAAS